MKNILWFLMIGFGLYACNSNRIYNEHYEVKEVLKWTKSDIKNFEYDVQAIDQKYNIAIALRHHSSINRKNVKVNFTITSPDKKSNSGNYILPIRDDRGNLLGDAGGDICDTENFILNEFQFKSKGIYKFSVEHTMKDDDLALIMEVGLIIDKVAKK